MDLKTAADTLILNRRSIYTNMFGEEEVDDAIVEKMLENANWAPTHKRTEPWRFVVFKGAGLKKLGDLQGELYRKRNPDTFDENKFIALSTKPLECSHVVAIGMHREEKESIPEVEEICAVACAVQNAWLTASAHKVGCYWSTGGVTFYKEAKPFFGLGEKDKLLGFLYIGKLKTDKWPDGKRSAVADKVRWVTQ